MSAPVFITLTETGEALARRLASDVSGAEVHGLANRTASPDISFSETMTHIASLFATGRPIIGICAAGCPKTTTKCPFKVSATQSPTKWRLKSKEETRQ